LARGSIKKNGKVSRRGIRQPAKTRKKWTEKQLLKGVRPAMCGPELIADRAGRELF
jgi:hypothetical protein